ncbi:MAG: YvrJ family protein [Bacillota bacterium]
MEEMLLHIGNYGFPMVVAAYLLVRVEKKLEMLALAIRDLQQAIGYLSYSGYQDGVFRSGFRSRLPEAAEAGEQR